ncbi:MAG: RluA family pseudouridine synthase [Clostridia bacterium]|nr:RluA family pseudouridine synthase [Clostridia bacterium]
MKKVEIKANDAGQRLDRFLKKYLRKAPLSAIYKIIRKDLKLNGKRAKEDTILKEGDELSFFMSDERFEELTGPVKAHRAKKQFRVAYEDEQVLIVEKPWGLLTHGDSREKKNTLMNQVCGYLQDKGEFDPSAEKTFTPSPVNRLDRNTTGLVIFGKTAESLRQLTALIRNREAVSKYYVTIVSGDFRTEMTIEEALEKNEKTNTVRISSDGQNAKSIVRPLERSADGKFSVVEVELVTGRTHQIRAHLAAKGYPLAGDSKYGTSAKGRRANDRVRKLGVTTQILHAYRLKFGEIKEKYEALAGLDGLEVIAEMPGEFERVWKELK